MYESMHAHHLDYTRPADFPTDVNPFSQMGNISDEDREDLERVLRGLRGDESPTVEGD